MIAEVKYPTARGERSIFVILPLRGGALDQTRIAAVKDGCTDEAVLDLQLSAIGKE